MREIEIKNLHGSMKWAKAIQTLLRVAKREQYYRAVKTPVKCDYDSLTKRYCVHLNCKLLFHMNSKLAETWAATELKSLTILNFIITEGKRIESEASRLAKADADDLDAFITNATFGENEQCEK